MIKCLVLTLSLLTTLANPAALAKASKKSRADKRGYKVMVIPREMDQVKKEMSKEYDVYMPKNVSHGDSGDRVASRVGDQVIQKWLDSEAGSGVASSVKKVENSMRAEATFGAPDAKKGTQHKVGFNVKAVEATTELKYDGWFNSVLKYDARGGQTTFEVNEKILDDKDLFLNHTATSTEDKSTVGMRWNW